MRRWPLLVAVVFLVGACDVTPSAASAPAGPSFQGVIRRNVPLSVGLDVAAATIAGLEVLAGPW